ncbi:MAG: molecular chaperone DnaJ [Polyangiaceae bacterium]|nr:molecular chaperone DnaJ [Polyangiaceae bacterium]
MKDPYEVLGIDRSATQDDVKGAFRKLAAKHHPDRNPDDPGASQRFKEINAAYQILSDPKKREMFDRFGIGDGARAPGGQTPFAGFDFSEINIDGIFGDLLGALGIKTGQAAPLQKEVKITFEEAAFGCTKELTYERVEPCVDCSGNGSAPGSTPETCGPCRGRGRVRVQQGVLPIALERPCSHCRGTGRIVKDPCKTCRGAGLIAKERTIEVTIPAGVENGATRLVERGGNYSRPERPAGDLELIVRVTPHEFFRRVGDDIVCSLPISFPQAALGGEIEIPTLDGKGRLRVPAGTQPGTILRVRGKGVPRRMMSGRGDQLVEITIEVPKNLDEHQRRLIGELAEALGNKIRPVSEPEATFMSRLKNLFGSGA